MGLSGSATPARHAARALLRLRSAAGRRPPRALAAPVALRGLVAYDGTDWAGWQRQHEAVSVAEVLEAALEEALRHPVTVRASGRTDAGVHAEALPVAFECGAALPVDGLRRLADMLLPPSVRLVHLEPAPADWDPQRAARSKLYRYRVLETPWPAPARERTAWRLGAPLDLRAMQAAAAPLVGRHDFRAYRNDPGPERRDEDTVRTLHALDVERRDDDELRLDVRGDGFLYMMVRNLAAALVEVGRGATPPSRPLALLGSGDRRLGPPPAPACGLTLCAVAYDDGFGRRPAAISPAPA